MIRQPALSGWLLAASAVLHVGRRPVEQCTHLWFTSLCFLALHRGVHAKCNFPLPEEEAFQAQLLASQQETWPGGQASPPAAPQPAASSQAALSQAVSIPCNDTHPIQPRSAVQVSNRRWCTVACR